MSNRMKTLHIFGGGDFVGFAESVAVKYGWSVVVRTSKRFVHTIGSLHEDTKLLVGDSLDTLMKDGGFPQSGDIGLSFSAPWIISPTIIDLFNGDIYNLHNQPLPSYRGGGGLSWNILMGDSFGGTCVHKLTSKIDAGDIVARRDFSFPNSFEFPNEFQKFTTNQAFSMLSDWLPVLLQDGLTGQPSTNDCSKSEYWPRLNTEIHGWIDWSWGLEDIQKFCNAFSYPQSGAKTYVNGRVLQILKVSINRSRPYHPYQLGLVFKILNDDLYVAHPDGFLCVHVYNTVDSSARIRLGDRLFTPREVLERAMSTRVQYLPSGEIKIQ